MCLSALSSPLRMESTMDDHSERGMCHLMSDNDSDMELIPWSSGSNGFAGRSVNLNLIETVLTCDEERFELYYDERERRNPKNKGLSYDELLKKSGCKPSTKE